MIDIFDSTEETITAQMQHVAERVKKRRLELNLSQEGLAKRADMPLPTYRLFEKTGKVSFRGLLQIAYALNCLQDFNQLFSQQQYESLDEMLLAKESSRKYGTKL